MDLLKLALDWAIVGDDEPVPLADRPAVRETTQATDPDAILRGWVHVITTIASRIEGLSAALLAAAAADDEAQQLWQQAQAQRLTGARAFVAHLAANAHLRPGLSLEHAADIAWLHSDPATYRRLVVERGWPNEHFEQWLFQTIKQQLLS